MLIDQPVPNLLGGVSQQPPLARFQNQLDRQINCVSDIVEGLRKRPPTEHIAKLISGPLSQRPCVFLIDRDEDNRFIALVAGGTVRVFDITDGTEKDVEGGTNAYLQTLQTPSASIRALTVADYTFILNREKNVERLAATVAPSRPFECVLFFRAANYGKTYQVDIRTLAGALAGAGAYTTPDGSNASHTLLTATDNIAAQVATNLDITLPPTYTVSQKGSLIYISGETDFTVTVEDGQGKQSLRAFKSEAQRFTDLPSEMPAAFAGFTVKVTGDSTTDQDDYWVRFNGLTWEETLAPGVDLRLDPETMPYALVHNQDDTFELIQLPWVDRQCGDEESNPFPSFVGSPLRGLMYVDNRLGFLADENVILSQGGDYFNFFRTTVQVLADLDPIDTPVPSTSGENSSVALLEHAVAFNKRTALFARNAQFVMHANGGPLTVSTVVIEPATSYKASPACRPIPLGSFVYFTFDREGASGVREMFVDGSSRVEDATEVTAHVPTYLPSGIQSLAANSLESVIVAVPSQGNVLYAYDYFMADGGKAQSAWGQWDFHANDDIVAYDFLDNVGYLVIERADGFHLERMRFRPGLTDPSLDYFSLLDRRVTDEDYTAVYSAITNQTTITLPWPVTLNMQLVTRHSDTAIHAPGVQVPIISAAGYGVLVAGDKTAWDLVIGVPYTQEFDPSRPYFITTSSAGSVANTEAKLKVKDYSLDFAGTGYFTVTYKPRGREAYTKTFTGQILGATASDIPPLEDGTFRIKTPTTNKYWGLTVSNDSPFPSRFLAASWRGLVESKSRRV